MKSKNVIWIGKQNDIIHYEGDIAQDLYVISILIAAISLRPKTEKGNQFKSKWEIPNLLKKSEKYTGRIYAAGFKEENERAIEDLKRIYQEKIQNVTVQTYKG